MITKLVDEKPIMLMIIVGVFAYLTRSTELVTAILLYLLIIKLTKYRTMRVLRRFAYGYMIVAALYGIFSFIFVFNEITSAQILFRNGNVIIALFALVIVIIRLVMFILYLALEGRTRTNKLFLLVLAFSIIEVLVVIFDSLITNSIYNVILNYNFTNGGIWSSITLPNSNVLFMFETILLVYLLVKSSDENIKVESTEEIV